MQLMIYTCELGKDRVTADANDGGRMVASEVLGGERADADYAEPTGESASLSALSSDDRRHFRLHGWC
jgi:hypothetical protein